MISVCMGIYNGEAYIEEQLLSILNQTLKPDQVVLCDDCSTDRTIEKVENFLKEYALEKKWELYVNDKNKGYPANFYYAMSLCKGDYVFLADQDDIWDNRKLERMMSILVNDSGACVVSCKFGLIDEEGKCISAVMQPAKSRGTSNVRNVDIASVFYKCEWPGMVMAYRRVWYEGKYKKWRARLQGLTEYMEDYPDIPHDFLICAWAAEDDGFRQLDEELAWHRRHSHNIGDEEHRISKLLNRERKLKEVQKYNCILEKFEKYKLMETESGKHALAVKYKVMTDRYQALLSGRISKVAINAIKNYHDTRIATVICDLAITVKKGKKFSC